jgi:hypothetical protein
MDHFLIFRVFILIALLKLYAAAALDVINTVKGPTMSSTRIIFVDISVRLSVVRTNDTSQQTFLGSPSLEIKV